MSFGHFYSFFFSQISRQKIWISTNNSSIKYYKIILKYVEFSVK